MLHFALCMSMFVCLEIKIFVFVFVYNIILYNIIYFEHSYNNTLYIASKALITNRNDDRKEEG